jgi:hypothetical protein
MISPVVCRLLLSGWLCLATTVRGEDLSVLPGNLDEGPARQMVTRHLKRMAYEALDRRQKAYEALKTPEQIALYQKQMRSTFVEHLGGFPERTPLHPRTVGTLVGDRFTTEKAIPVSPLRVSESPHLQVYLSPSLTLTVSPSLASFVLRTQLARSSLEFTRRGGRRGTSYFAGADPL